MRTIGYIRYYTVVAYAICVIVWFRLVYLWSDIVDVTLLLRMIYVL